MSVRRGRFVGDVVEPLLYVGLGGHCWGLVK